MSLRVDAFPGFDAADEFLHGGRQVSPTWESHGHSRFGDNIATPATPKALRGGTRGDRALDAACAGLLLFLALLHVARLNECCRPDHRFATLHHFVHGSASDEWQCSTDPFARSSFLPLHLCAIGAGAAWIVLALRGGIRLNPSALRAIEVFIACWALCWFTAHSLDAAATPAAAAVGGGSNCTNDNTMCAHWATTNECEKNKKFMEETCRLACKLCDPNEAAAGGGAEESAEASRRLADLVALGAWPRALSVGAGGALCFLAIARLLSLAQLSLAALRVLASWALRLLRIVLACMLNVKALRCCAACLVRCSNWTRRRLIVVLGGSLEAAGGDFSGAGVHARSGSADFDQGLPMSMGSVPASPMDARGHVGMLQPLVASFGRDADKRK